MPINMRKRKGEKRVFIFVIEHNTNTITILLPLLYSSLSARKFCLLTEKYARKKTSIYSSSIGRNINEKRESYIYLIFQAHSKEPFSFIIIARWIAGKLYIHVFIGTSAHRTQFVIVFISNLTFCLSFSYDEKKKESMRTLSVSVYI